MSDVIVVGAGPAGGAGAPPPPPRGGGGRALPPAGVSPAEPFGGGLWPPQGPPPRSPPLPAAAPPRPRALARMALVTYVTGLADVGDHGEIFVAPPDYAILNPVARDRVNMSLVVPLAHAAPFSDRLDTFFAARVKQLRHLARRVAGGTIVARVRALGPLAYRVLPPAVGGVLLVGDAAGFYDPFTGEGIFTGLRSAELAAETATVALRSGDCSAAALGAFTRARHAVFGGKERLTRALQLLIGHRRVADLAAHVLARRPALLDVVLGAIGD